MPITAGIISKTVKIKIGMRYFTTVFEKRISDYISFLLGFLLYLTIFGIDDLRQLVTNDLNGGQNGDQI